VDPRSLIIALALGACAGPDPRVHDAIASPSPRPGATRVAMDIVNRAGHGTIEIRIELRGAGRVIVAERTLELDDKQTVHFETDIETPPGSFTVRATAQYPD
jgi:hypothetical protein